MEKSRPVTIDDYVLLTYIKTDELTGVMTEIKMLKQRPKRVTFDVQFDLDQSNLVDFEVVGG